MVRPLAGVNACENIADELLILFGSSDIFASQLVVSVEWPPSSPSAFNALHSFGTTLAVPAKIV